MRYYSDVTKKFYNTENECLKEEQKLKAEQERKQKAEAKKQEERAKDAKAVEQAREAMIEAQNAYRKAMETFVNKYGSYHFTTRSVNEIPHLFDFFDLL